ncbi:MAG TPA: ATP-dependent protease ATPase subunit HslU [Rectinemataceae bacterium]|nr:ATP-dependent protease ATPase subunit HslU [Rectinemataceae bacterium]
MSEEAVDLTPRRIVEELDRYIIGQLKAKRAVAIALRNRIRRQRLPAELADEIAPKNILMIGPTGVGKTEIARRLAKLCGAPFIKVEATKYTEVGYVGRDVESMVRDLMASGIQMVKAELQLGVKEEAARRAEERVLDLLLPGVGKQADGVGKAEPAAPASSPFAPAPNLAMPGAAPFVAPDVQEAPKVETGPVNETREKFRAMLRAGKLDAREVEITVQAQRNPAIEIFSGNQMEEMEVALGGLANIFGGKKKKRAVSVKEALGLFSEEELDKLVDQDKAIEIARERVQESGIIFIDEIDKIANRESKGGSGADVSREGVQRDILPIIEGSTVTTKWGPVDTTHVLFIAAGAFNVSKPQDLIPELQGRFPIRVELEALGVEEFRRILTEPKNALTAQYTQLLGTEEVTIVFTPEAVTKLAEIAAAANTSTENIGARRLQTVMERLLEELSFEAPDMKGAKVDIDAAFVDSRFKDFAERQDLSRYIL